MAKKETSNRGAIAAVGIAVVAASAAAYLLFGPDGKKNRKAIRGWAVKMKGEIIEKLESAKEVTEPVYHDIVNKVAEKYSKLKNVNPDELLAVIEDARKQWKHMMRDAKPKKKKKVAKKTA